MTDINEFNMPFLMDTDVAATKMVKAIDNGKKTYILDQENQIGFDAF